jgi:hypothetical protein
MKSASVNEIKKALEVLTPKELRDLCVRLIKYKKENKELIGFLLFDADNLTVYMNEVKKEMDVQFEEINKTNLYFAKKSIRKILRITNKYIKYSGSKQVETELLIHFCKRLRKSGIEINKSQMILNIYLRQTFKIKKTMNSLHEDLRYDYEEDVRILMS